MGDRYVSFPLRVIVVPFASSDEPLLVAAGQTGPPAVGAADRQLPCTSSYRRASVEALHYASFVAFWMAFVHGLALGSESATLWASFLCLGTAAPVIFLSLRRVLSTQRLHGLLVGNAHS